MTATPHKRQRAHDRLLGRLPDLDQPTLATLAQRLTDERDLLETICHTIQEGVLILDPTGLITYTNRAAATILGLTESDTGKAIFWKLVPALARTLGLRFDPATGATLPPPRHATDTFPAIAREIEITYPEPRHIRLHLCRVGEDPEDRRLVAILRDITAEKTTTEDLLETERINSILTLAASVAHEIGNPLNSITIHLQLIRRKLDRLPPARETPAIANSLKVCADEITRLDGIIRHFLEAIRPQPPDLADVHPLQILAEVLGLLQTQCEDLAIRVHITTPQGILPLVSGDPNQLKQVFFNLLKNSMEAMDSGGEIEITATHDDEYVTLHLRDTGKGMERDELTRMFDPFFTTKKGGHGLGMMVVMRILRAHGGDLGVESTPGLGTTVTVRLPQKHRRIRLLPQPASA